MSSAPEQTKSTKSNKLPKSSGNDAPSATTPSLYGNMSNRTTSNSMDLHHGTLDQHHNGGLADRFPHGHSTGSDPGTGDNDGVANNNLTTIQDIAANNAFNTTTDGVSQAGLVDPTNSKDKSELLELAQQQVTAFRFEASAVDYYENLSTTIKSKGHESMLLKPKDMYTDEKAVEKAYKDAYKTLSSMPTSRAVVAALQHAGANKQKLELQALGAEYEVGMFDLIRKPDSTTVHANAFKIKDAERSLANSMRALHRRTSHFINNFASHQGFLDDGVNAIFDKIKDISDRSAALHFPTTTTETNAKGIGESELLTYNHYQRQIFCLLIKLSDRVPLLCEWEVPLSSRIAELQSFVPEKYWPEFIQDYQNIIAKSGSNHADVKKAVNALKENIAAGKLEMFESFEARVKASKINIDVGPFSTDNIEAHLAKKADIARVHQKATAEQHKENKAGRPARKAAALAEKAKKVAEKWSDAQKKADAAKIDNPAADQSAADTNTSSGAPPANTNNNGTPTIAHGPAAFLASTAPTNGADPFTTSITSATATALSAAPVIPAPTTNTDTNTNGSSSSARPPPSNNRHPTVEDSAHDD